MKGIIHLLHKINKPWLILTFTSFHFLMIKVTSCKVSVKLSTGSFLWLSASGFGRLMNQIETFQEASSVSHTHFINLWFIHYGCGCGGKQQPQI